MRVITLFVALAGCGVEGLETNTDTVSGELQANVEQHITILPSDTCDGLGIGAGGTWAPNDAHEAYRPPVYADPKLVVFFPGCSGAGGSIAPAGYSTFLEHARDLGFYVIGLDYPGPCAGDPYAVCGTDAACFGAYRAEITSGIDAIPGTSLELNTHPQDAIMRRLKCVLTELRDTSDPTGGWGNFFHDDPTNPSNQILHHARITYAGHSLGAGYAPFIAKSVGARRVVMMSGASDAIDKCTGATGSCQTDPTSSDPAEQITDATWLASHVTPSSVYFGLVHEDDVGSNHYNRAMSNYDALGMDLATQSWTGTTCSLSSMSGHMCVAKDEATYGAIWDSMLGTP
jgi:hypothetical protein